MFNKATNEILRNQLYNEWMNNLTMYNEELGHLEQLVKEWGYKSYHLDTAIELDALKELIKVEKAEIEALTIEVMQKHKDIAQQGVELSEGVIAFAQVIKNNQLREKIRKAEHSVFYLKYHVNKLLSLAS